MNSTSIKKLGAVLLWLVLTLSLILVFAEFAPAASFRVQAPVDWTSEVDDAPIIDVTFNSWFTREDGTMLTEGVLIGPLLQGELRPIDSSAYAGTGDRVCVNGWAERQGRPETRVQAARTCATFPLYQIVPPTFVFIP